MNEIGLVTLAKLIEAHYEKDEDKFKSYVNFIIESFEEKGDYKAAKIIKRRLDGSYKESPKVVETDIIPNDELYIVTNVYLNEIDVVPYYTLWDGKDH